MGQDSAYVPIEETRVFAQFVRVAAQCWDVVSSWSVFEKDTLGKQLVRAIDSVGANLVEGDGRFRDTDALHFFVIARASSREAEYWVRLAAARHLMQDGQASELIAVIQQASRDLNGLIACRRKHLNTGKVKETPEIYFANTDAD